MQDGRPFRLRSINVAFEQEFLARDESTDLAGFTEMILARETSPTIQMQLVEELARELSKTYRAIHFRNSS